MRNHSSVKMIEIAAEGIYSIPGIDPVIVGGAATCLYINDECERDLPVH